MTILTLDRKLSINKGLMDAPNLCDRLSEDDLVKIGNMVYEGYVRDKRSRSTWERRMEAGMDLAMQIQKDKNFPWPGCSNVVFPLITIASLQFSARSYTNLVQGSDIVRYRVIGSDKTGQLRSAADRISDHMSWQVLEEDASWEEQHDRLLINLGIVGTNFIKTYYNSTKGHIVSELVMARDFVLNYYAKSVEDCARKTQVIPLYQNEMYERVKRGVFNDVLSEDWFNSRSRILQPNPKVDQRSGLMASQIDEDTPFSTLEQHRLLDLDGDGYAEPYIVTIEESSRKVLRIVARFDREEDVERTTKGDVIRIKPTEYYTKYSFIPSPDGGIYDVGFGILLGPLNESVNSGINQLLDSGTMQNSMGGFLGRGAKIRGGVYTMAPWEWKRVDSTGDDLRKSMVPFPERQPSNVMFQLLGLLIDYTDRISGSTDVMVGKNPGQNTPAESYRSMIEQGSQVYNMVFKRVWRSMKEEFKKRHMLNAMYMPVSKKFGVGDSVVRREDYRGNPDLVVPVADPNVTSTPQRLAQAQALRMAARESPGYDITEVEKNFLRALRIEGIDKYYPGPEKKPAPPDPRIELEKIKLQGKTVQFQHEKQMFALDLMEQRRLNTAKIYQLTAQAQKLAAETGTVEGTMRLKTLDTVIKAMQAHNDIINSKLEEMEGEGNDGADSGGGAVPGMAAGPGDDSLPGAVEEMAGGIEGAMGEGNVPEGVPGDLEQAQ